MALDTQLPSSTRDSYLRRIEQDLNEIPEFARLDALRYAIGLLDRGLPVLFDLGHLAFVSGVDPQIVGSIRQQPNSFYRRFLIRKRNGGSRVISAPTPQLRALQDWLHINVTSHLRVHDAAHGFVPQRSIVTNAALHVGRPVLLKLDIKDFFGSVGRRPVYRAFRRLGYRREMADLMTSLVTLEGGLPQGAPTSPALANNAAYGLDVRISAFVERRGITYTRYADDLTLSGPAVGDRSVRRTVEKIMRDEGFLPNESKRRFVRPHERQRVTGVVVNQRLGWPRERRRWLRQEIHYLQRFGVASHLERRGSTRAGYRDYIYGHVYALNMLHPDEAGAYFAVLDQLDWI
ncbi:MAG TPA: reverse transcriptase family protein [Solirubrobacterales bacterium]|nr:reverse transcriptase family protein [Solirubrobacterales bacterium]